MVSVTISNPLGFWVVGTDEIKEILARMKPCMQVLRTHGYANRGAVVGGGVHERDTGYEDFFHKYDSFEKMEENLCDDFDAAESELDGLWFNTLNFEFINVWMEKGTQKGLLAYSRGELYLKLDDVDQVVEMEIQAILEPYRYISA